MVHPVEEFIMVWVWNNAIFDPAIELEHTVSYYYEDVNGCTSTSTGHHSRNWHWVVTLAGLLPMALLVNRDTINRRKSCRRNVYQWSGVNGIYLILSIGMGIYAITYSYTDANGCSSSASKTWFVDVCTSIPVGREQFQVFSVYPIRQRILYESLTSPTIQVWN